MINMLYPHHAYGGILLKHARSTKPWYSAPKHCHEFHEIYYVVSGKRTCYIGDSKYDFEAGDFVLIPPNVPHTNIFRAGNIYERFVINIMQELDYMDDLRDILQDNCVTIIKIEEKKRPSIVNILDSIESECKNKDPFSTQMIAGYLYQLLIKAKRLANHNAGAAAKSHPIETIVADAVGFIHENYQSKITVDTIAQKYHVSPCYFSRSFKKITNTRFIDYINHVRIQHAASLLAESQRPITQIAFECGFTDSSYFASVFKDIIGITPLKYRNLIRDNPNCAYAKEYMYRHIV